LIWNSGWFLSPLVFTFNTVWGSNSTR
jgi:hypothetical protein